MEGLLALISNVSPEAAASVLVSVVFGFVLLLVIDYIKSFNNWNGDQNKAEIQKATIGLSIVLGLIAAVIATRGIPSATIILANISLVLMGNQFMYNFIYMDSKLQKSIVG